MSHWQVQDRSPRERSDTRDNPGYRFHLRSSSYGGQAAHPGYAFYALAGAGGDSATAASVVSRRKVNVSCK
jgi:hypothetical protein